MDTYEKKLALAKEALDSGSYDKETFEYIFPELKESEDERIIKAIKSAVLQLTDIYLQEKYGLKQSDCIAWLEKQGEHANFRNKIQIGDKVTRNEDGVLVNLSQLKRVAKKDEKQGEQKSLGFNIGDEITVNGQICKVVAVEQKPADKVEPKFKVKYAGSEYNVLEVKDIAGVTFYGIEDEPNHIDYVLPNNCEIVSEQESAWSEEDEINLGKAIWYVENPAPMVAKDSMLVEWLKNLRGRVQPQLKQEWSEEDKEMLNQVIEDIVKLAGPYVCYHKDVDWLKSLKDRVQAQNRWKPSDEQMKALDDVISSRNIRYDVLSELWKDLNKLK